MKRFVFAGIPLLVVALLLESGARVWALADPQIFTRPLPEEEGGLFRDDPLLFWRLAENLDIDYRGNRVRTNALGHRSPELGARERNEYRILSLGESTTFGTGVEDGETYSARLEAHLNRIQRERKVRVLNAGTPAHSSYQFQRYLRERGVALEPDLVLVYSEINDYLPASLRDSSHHEIGVSLSDAELASSRGSTLRRWLETNSAFYRALSFARARSRIAQFDAGTTGDPLQAIGLPTIGLKPRLFERRGEGPYFEPAGVAENRLPPRVRPHERIAHLEAIAQTCEENDIELLLIHPAYRHSRPHECPLTQFADERGVPLLEAHSVLHPEAREPEGLFLDLFHPDPEGHIRLGRALAETIRSDFLRDASALVAAGP